MRGVAHVCRSRICCSVRTIIIRTYSQLSPLGVPPAAMARTKQRARKARDRIEKEEKRKEALKQNVNMGEQADSRKGERQGYVQKVYIKENAKFERYYKTQQIVPEEEWEQFMEALRKPLPSSFRITGYKKHGQEFLKIIKGDYFADLHNMESEDLQPPKCLTWYPGEMAWQMNLDRKKIRNHSELEKLHKFLVSETESGNISRQEAVSMIPPLLMDIKPHHKVLDMCAAPGSKTAQLIEMLHADSEGAADGIVVANDSDNKRCYLMCHQVKRLASPNFVIINHDASHLPNLFLGEGKERKLLQYDRILCDVPCSGDGTMRKNPDVWQKWHTNSGHNLHSLQARILKRGLMALENDGRLVYSTCSFNPVENEAVIGSLLDSCEGAVELLDVSSILPNLKYRKGLTTWKVMTRSGDLYDTPADIPAHMTTTIRPTMFPPTKEDTLAQLPRCVRLVPHDQDTGGFFVAVLHKLRDLPWMNKRKRSAQAASSQTEQGEQSEIEPKEKEMETENQSGKDTETGTENEEGTNIGTDTKGPVSSDMLETLMEEGEGDQEMTENKTKKKKVPTATLR